MKAAKLYSARDIRVEAVPNAPPPKAGEVLIRVRAVGICGSDLHMYEDGRIGDTSYDSPLILGHEFVGEIVAVGKDASDGNHQALAVGQRVAVDPNSPCYRCEMCQQGHPNLCPNHTFYGVYPTDGALQECMIVNARNCFPIPDHISDAAGSMLETLGIAIHAVDLAKIKVANTVAVIGCGPVGLLILQQARIAGASRVFAFDMLDWRVNKARELGAEAWNVNGVDPLAVVDDSTNGRGADVVLEAAWSDSSIQLAAELARIGGRIVIVGIPGDDQFRLQHSTARRKGLSIIMVRRMKHTYPRAIALATSGTVELDGLVSHHFSLDKTPEAFRMNAAYEVGVHKIVIDI